MSDEHDQIHIDLASDISEGEAARKKLEQIGDQADAIKPAFDRAREANGRFTSSLTDAEREARRTSAALKDAAASAAALGRATASGGGHDGSNHGNHTTYATARDTYDTALPHRRVTDAIEKEEAGFRKLRDAMLAHEATAATDAAALDRLGDRAAAAGRKLDKVHPGRLTGADRAGAMSRAGLLGANMLQDTIQGGNPAFAINNILGAANDKGIKALAGEAVQALGGLRMLAAGFGTVAVAAGAAYLVINHGLKEAKLDWSDFGDVVGNLAPIRAATEATVGFWDAAANTQAGQVIAGTWETLGDGVHYVAEVTLGWDEATEAARKHKDEVAAGVKATLEFVEAAKALAGVQSEASKSKQEQGKAVAGELAELGGEGDIGAVADRLADQATQHTAKDENGKDRMVTVRKVNEKGEDAGTEEITRREAARRQAMIDLHKAQLGDKDALSRLRPQLSRAGYDTTGVDRAAAGDPAADEKFAKLDDEAIASKDDERKRKKQEKRDRENAADKLGSPLQERFNTLSGSGQTPDREGVKRQLIKGGASEDQAERRADDVLKSLTRGFDEAVRRKAGETGLDAAGAKAAIGKEGQDKAQAEASKLARDKAEKAMAGTGADGRIDDALMRSALQSGGKTGVASKEVTDKISLELQGKGMSKEDADVAAKDQVDKRAAKLGDDINDEARKPKDRDKLDAPSRIASTDFARSVEGSGASDAKKLLTTTEAMKEKLTDLVRLAQLGPRLGP
jgi:hypothetical protein